jgi:hypothetical protein
VSPQVTRTEFTCKLARSSLSTSFRWLSGLDASVIGGSRH